MTQGLIYQLTEDYEVPRVDVTTPLPEGVAGYFLHAGFEFEWLPGSGGFGLSTSGRVYLMRALVEEDTFEAWIPVHLLEGVPAVPAQGPPAFSRLSEDVWND